MKLAPQNTQQDNNKQQHKQNNTISDNQLIHYNLSQQQLQTAKKTIQKINNINKFLLTSFKKKYPLFNQLFCIMSTFFVQSRKKNAIIKKDLKAIRIQKRKQQLQLRFQKNKQKIVKRKSLIDIQQQQNQIIQQNIQPQIQQNIPQIQLLPKHRICYICTQKYIQIDTLYHKHCPPCAAFAKLKRFQTADLKGKIGLVTGARVKIGYEITLRLLRDGATIYATTRFTNDALLRYQQQSDYEQFKDRLFLIQCDFLCSPQVTSLINYLKSNVTHLDILIHNAAQTLVRPPQFYTFQLQNQQKQLQYNQNHLINFQNKSYPSIQFNSFNAIKSQQQLSIDLTHSDQFGQPLDIRSSNTWKQKIQEVSLVDCLSTQIINSTVPFHITGQLRCIMGGSIPSFIINVSSMEGVFYRDAKTCFHPHTNMAKASLNMITRTCAHQLSLHNIFMNSVDTGWVTNQNPFMTLVKMKVYHDFDPPLDCIEGAMRVIDPIYQGIREGKFIFGKFLKNYHVSSW